MSSGGTRADVIVAQFNGTPVTEGQQLPGLEVRLTRERIVRYSGASTDFNPIHYNDRSALAIGLPGVVVHGMWTMGTALRVVTQWCGDPALIASYSVRFTKPVVVPDTEDGVVVRFAGTVEAVADGLATIAIDARCGDDAVLGRARAMVRVAAEASGVPTKDPLNE